MPQPSVAANVDESPDITVYLAAQVALLAVVGADQLALVAQRLAELALEVGHACLQGALGGSQAGQGDGNHRDSPFQGVHAGAQPAGSGTVQRVADRGQSGLGPIGVAVGPHVGLVGLEAHRLRDGPQLVVQEHDAAGRGVGVGDQFGLGHDRALLHLGGFVRHQERRSDSRQEQDQEDDRPEDVHGSRAGLAGERCAAVGSEGHGFHLWGLSMLRPPCPRHWGRAGHGPPSSPSGAEGQGGSPIALAGPDSG